jgi:hypothetical protein
MVMGAWQPSSGNSRKNEAVGLARVGDFPCSDSDGVIWGI